MRVVFSTRAYAALLAETAEKIKTETGGLFLGTVQDGVWYIIETIDPGPKSVFEVAYFEYDREYTQHLINKVAALYECELSLIGLWHRHPGSMDFFSSTDDGTNAKYASMRDEGAISALVNIDPDFRLTMYHVDKNPFRYSKIKYEVGDRYIPDSLLKYGTAEHFENLMKNRLYGRGTSANGYHMALSLEAFMKYASPGLSEAECELPKGIGSSALDVGDRLDEIMDIVMDDVEFLADTIGIETSMAMNEKFLVIYQLAKDKPVKLMFAVSPEEKLLLVYDKKCYAYRKNLIKDAFEKEKRAKSESENADKDARETGTEDAEAGESSECEKESVISKVIKKFKSGK